MTPLTAAELADIRIKCDEALPFRGIETVSPPMIWLHVSTARELLHCYTPWLHHHFPIADFPVEYDSEFDD